MLLKFGCLAASEFLPELVVGVFQPRRRQLLLWALCWFVHGWNFTGDAI